MTTIRARLDADRDLIVERYRDEGMSAIAKDYGCNPGTLWYAMKAWGVETRKRADNYGEAQLFDEQIRELKCEGLSAYAISRVTGLSKPTVLRRGAAIGLDFSDNSKLKNPVRLKDRLAEAESLRKEGLSCDEIGRRLGYRGNHVVALLRKHGHHVQQNTYEVDLHYFDKIDTEGKAYLLGFWYADGNVVWDKIRLQITDREVLEFARDQLRYTGPIDEVPPRSENCKTQYRLSVARKELVRSLTALGCVPHKSLTLRFPEPDAVPADLLHHFCRGYFDGDGSIGFYTGMWRTQTVGTRHVLEGMSIASGAPGYWSQRYPERGKDNWTWTVAKRADLCVFLRWLYRDASFSLARKRQLAERCVAELDSRS